MLIVLILFQIVNNSKAVISLALLQFSFFQCMFADRNANILMKVH